MACRQKNPSLRHNIWESAQLPRLSLTLSARLRVHDNFAPKRWSPLLDAVLLFLLLRHRSSSSAVHLLLLRDFLSARSALCAPHHRSLAGGYPFSTATQETRARTRLALSLWNWIRTHQHHTAKVPDWKKQTFCLQFIMPRIEHHYFNRSSSVAIIERKMELKMVFGFCF